LQIQTMCDESASLLPHCLNNIDNI